MSLYDKASLVMIPSGYKASSATLYSVVPNTSVGDFDVTVDADATRVNKDGLIESVSANQARLDYPLTDGVVGDCPTLLLEPSRTNLLVRSEDLSTTWITASASVTTNTHVSPDGNTTADTLTITGSSGSVYQDNITVTASTDYTLTFYVKRGTIASDETALAVRDQSAGAFIDQNIAYTAETDKWTRIEHTFTTPVGCTSVRVYPQRKTGGGIGTIFLWGFQLELGDYPTSYIPTTNFTVTRSAETCNGAGDSSTFNDSEGVLFVEFAALANDLTHRRIAISDGTTSNLVYISFDTANNRILANANGRILLYTVSDETEFQKAAVYYNATAPKLYVNGVLRETETAMNAISGLNELAFDNGAGSNNFYGKVKQVMVFNEALTDSELEQLTS